MEVIVNSGSVFFNKSDTAITVDVIFDGRIIDSKYIGKNGGIKIF